MLYIHSRVIAVIIGCFAAHSGSAQEATRIIAGDPGNRFYGQHQVVEDHTSCAGPDQLAFRVPLIADSLSYQVYDADTRSTAWVSGDRIVSDQQCFIRQGFGKDSIAVEIECADDTRAAFLEQIRSLDISVRLQANVTACLSPIGIELVDSNWAVTVSGDGHTDVHSSENIAQNDGFQGQGVELVSPSVDFDYLSEGLGWKAWPWGSRGHPFVSSFGKKNVIRIDMSCIPVDRTNGSSARLFLGFRGDFAIVDEPKQSCVGADCPLFLDSSSHWRGGARRSCRSS